MLGVAQRIVALMNELRPLASEVAHDRNERDYLVHVMMLRALRDDPSLSRASVVPGSSELLPN